MLVRLADMRRDIEASRDLRRSYRKRTANEPAQGFK